MAPRPVQPDQIKPLSTDIGILEGHDGSEASRSRARRTFTLPDGVRSAQIALFADTIQDYERLRLTAPAEHVEEHTRFDRDTGKPYTIASWTEQISGDARYVSVNVHAPTGWQPRRIANL
jgi:hypothetical protein